MNLYENNFVILCVLLLKNIFQVVYKPKSSILVHIEVSDWLVFLELCQKESRKIKLCFWVSPNDPIQQTIYS
jgi:hypothetical protein